MPTKQPSRSSDKDKFGQAVVILKSQFANIAKDDIGKLVCYVQGSTPPQWGIKFKKRSYSTMVGGVMTTVEEVRTYAFFRDEFRLR